MTMTTTTTTDAVGPDGNPLALKRTARVTGVLYLGLAITGALSFLLIRTQLFDAGDPNSTLANLTERSGLARLGIALEMGTVITQALVAVWFYRLFRSVDSFAAGSLAAFGLVNATIISGSAAMLAAAVDVAGDTPHTAAGGSAGTAQLLYELSGHLWGESEQSSSVFG